MKNTIKETILKYSNILTENAKAESVGNLIIKLYNRHDTDNDILKAIDTIAKKDWVSVHIDDSVKTVKINIIPMDWSGGNGIDIDDLAAKGHNEQEAAIIHRIMNLWVENIIKEVKSKYKGYTVHTPQRNG